jgi:hypothetical protein
MDTISKVAAKKLHAPQRGNAMQESASHEGSASTPPTLLPKFPDINVHQEADNYFLCMHCGIEKLFLINSYSQASWSSA